MYRSCIFCSSDLGANEVLEEFPVGSRIAFDAWKGRLWVVCPKCTRWNLSPLEERWEAVESAEKLFRDARLRVQSENVGLAKLPDGTRLIRVGKALPGELAAWRYGRQLLDRRKQYFVGTGAAAVGVGALLVGGWPLLSAAGLSVIPVQLALQIGGWVSRYQRSRRAVYRVAATESPTGEDLVIRYFHLARALLRPANSRGEIALHIPEATEPQPREMPSGAVVWSSKPVILKGAAAHTVLARALVTVNARGASRKTLDASLALLGTAGSADVYLRQMAERRVDLAISDVIGYLPTPRQFLGTFRGERFPALRTPKPMPAPEALALEMALHEESERRAMEGELAALEAAWREAEEIAQIADALPDDPLQQLEMEEQRK